MAEPGQRNPFVYVSGAFAAVWVLVAWAAPQNNFFLFPILVAGALPLGYRLSLGRPLPWPAALGAATGGVINVAIVASLLAVAGKLDGEPLLPAGGLVVEALVLGLAGGGAAAVLAAWPWSR